MSDVNMVINTSSKSILIRYLKSLTNTRQLRHQKMYEINYQRLINDTRQIRQDKRIKPTIQLNIDLNKILRETTIDLTTQHEQTLEKTIKQLNKAIEENGLIKVPNIKQNKKLQEKLKKLEKQIIRENKRLEKKQDKSCIMPEGTITG